MAAAVAIAVSPLHVRDSHYVKHDVPVTLLIVLAYLAYQKLFVDVSPEGGSDGITARKVQTRSFRLQAEGPLLAAAAITGLAFSTHYYAIFLAIPLAWSAAAGGATRADAVRRVAIAALVSAVVFFLLSPFILAEPCIAIRDIRANRQIVVDRAVGSLGYGATLARYAVMLVQDTVGWPFVVSAGIGILVLARERPRLLGWLLAFPVPFFLFIAGTFPASRYLIPLVPFLAAPRPVSRSDGSHGGTAAAAWAILAALAVMPFQTSLKTDLFFRQTDTRTLAQSFIETHLPAGATILTQPYSVPLEPTAASLREAVERSGKEMPTKTRLQIEREPYPSPAYRLLYFGLGLDADKLYLPVETLDATDPLALLRAGHVAFVVLKRYNTEAPAMLPLTAALAREGRRLAVFSPYRTGTDTRPEPFLHNTDARITAALERSGPVVEIWQINGPGS